MEEQIIQQRISTDDIQSFFQQFHDSQMGFARIIFDFVRIQFSVCGIAGQAPGCVHNLLPTAVVDGQAEQRACVVGAQAFVLLDFSQHGRGKLLAATDVQRVDRAGAETEDPLLVALPAGGTVDLVQSESGWHVTESR